MTVYVDNMNAFGRIARGSRTVTGEWSQLLADDAAELAEFALNLGLLPEWLRAPGTPGEYYEVGEVTRRRAVAAGAVPISFPRGTGNVIATKTLQAAALDAAGRGWHVFPLRPGSKVPAVRHWEHAATTDADRITDVWTADLRRRDGWFVPEPRNVGIACGPSGLVVLDLDVPKAQDRAGWAEHWRSRGITSGGQVLDALAEEAGHGVPDTYAVTTPSGGRHLYFAVPDGVHLRNSAGRVGPLVDVRGAGGYVVAPGSRIHPHHYEPHVETVDLDQLTYRLVNDGEPVRLPGWLVDAAVAERRRDERAAAGRDRQDSRDRPSSAPSAGYGSAALRGEVDRVRSAPVGQRNHTLNAAAYSLGQLVAADVLSKSAVVESLTAAAQAAGLAGSEIAATIDSGLTAGVKDPRLLPQPEVRHGVDGVAHAGPQAQDQQQQQAAETSEARTGAHVLDDLDRAFDRAPAAAIETAARLVAGAASDERSAVLREAATRIADLVDVDGIDGQAALDALTAAAGRVGMARADIDAAIGAGFAHSQGPGEVSLGPGGQKPGPQYRIDEVDAAYAGWLFAEAWYSWSTDREPCHPADTLRVACEWEGLPTLGKSHLRDRPRPPTPFIPAPGEELVDRDVYYSWSQAQTDAWHASQAERRRAATTGRKISRPIPDSSPPPEAVAQASPAAEELAGTERPPGESTLSQPVNADALVRSLLAVLQPRGVIDREAWNATVTGVAERSAAAETRDRVDQSEADRPDPPIATTTPTSYAPDAREATSAGRPEPTRGEATAPDPGVERVDPGPRINVERDGSVENLTDVTDAEPPAPPTPSPDQPHPVEAEPAPAEAPDRTANPHTVFDEAIGQARAAVSRLEANRAASHRSRDETPDAGVHHDRPAYWAEPEVEL